MHIWTEGPGGLQFVGSQESDMTECLSIYIHTCVCVCICPSAVSCTHQSSPQFLEAFIYGEEEKSSEEV